MGSWFIFLYISLYFPSFYYHFLNRYKNCTYFKCTVWSVLTYIDTRETIPTTKTMNRSTVFNIFFLPLQNSPLPFLTLLPPHVCACMLSHFSHVWLCNAMNCSSPGSYVHGILQARILEWVAMPSFRDLPNPGIEPISFNVSWIGRQVFTTSTTWEALPRHRQPLLPVILG